MKNKINVFVVGGYTSYANWLDCNIVNTVQEADLVFFTGGEDVNPAYYGEIVGMFTDFTDRDIQEFEIAKIAIAMNKPIWGTCRGIQLGCVVAGGKLVQHMNHPHQHKIRFYDNTVTTVNSLHHQLQHPYNLKKTDYRVVAFSEGLSNVYLNGYDKDRLLPSVKINGTDVIQEAELCFYNKINWFGAQWHPEMMSKSSEINRILRKMVQFQIEGILDTVLLLKIPVSRFMQDDFVLLEDELELVKSLENKKETV